jgi:hypothetical protein
MIRSDVAAMAITPGIRPVSTLDASKASIGEATSEDLHDTHARMPIAVRRIRFAITAYSRSFDLLVFALGQ